MTHLANSSCLAVPALNTDILGHHLHGSGSSARSMCPLTPRPAQLSPGCGSCPAPIWAAPVSSLQGAAPTAHVQHPVSARGPEWTPLTRSTSQATLWQGRPWVADAALAFQSSSLALLPGTDCWHQYSTLALRHARHGASQLCLTNKRIWPR